MKPVLTPRELAEAVGVSESSLKRWADDGRVRVSRTAGGHRRIPIAEAIRFIRASRLPIVRPDLLGLPDIDAATRALDAGDGPTEQLTDFLVNGRAAEARGLLLSLYLNGESLAAISDGPIGQAMRHIGDRWQESPRGIFIEHRASEICIEAVRQLRLTLAPPRHGPIAVGGAAPHDTGALPTLLAATVLAAEGYQTTNLGPQTPLDTLYTAAFEQHARLAWIAAGHPNDNEHWLNTLNKLGERLKECGTRLIVGGYYQEQLPAPVSENIYTGKSMAELAAFARGMLNGNNGSEQSTSTST